MLPDGRYDAVVVDADEVVDADGPSGAAVVRVDLAIAAGEHRGEVVTVHAAGLGDRDPLDLLAVPVTLTVADGQPKVRFEG
ncbi:MAG TPA: hypothetical protein VHA73_06815 [Acidimicrobiales bacterium]|nr:hypothetical protein [Acidimicrobiales bacterium]